MLTTDLLVIGSGISGLSYAIKVAHKLPDTKITLVTKSTKEECNTKYAQGGLAVVTNFEEDSFEKHIKDTLIAGDYECNEKIVRIVVEEGPKRVQEIIDWGTQFDKIEGGKFSRGMEGGHCENRVIHHKDITGAEIERALLEKVAQLKNIEILEHHYVIDLITEHHIPKAKFEPKNLNCYGAYVLDVKNEFIKKITAKVTVLASGGSGHTYRNTTNPTVATGDGIGLAYRAYADIKNMQYVQFHPTALYSNRSGRLFLISEALRGFGAKLRTADGKPFMHKYDKREELASRDIVARAIDAEMKKSGDDYVMLDCRHLDQEKFLKHFPNIYQKCKDEGIDCFTDLIPVVPAMHYQCGGINVDQHAQTSIAKLLAIGECTCSGLHGANRLASNSLLEGIVFGHRAAEKTVEFLIQDDFNYPDIERVPDWDQNGMELVDEMILVSYLRRDLQALMSDLVGIVRSDKRLKLALQKETDIYNSVQELYQMSILSPQLSELRNLVSVAYLTIKSSMAQKENKGAFFNKDLV